MEVSSANLTFNRGSSKNVVWITPVNQLTRVEQAYTYYGNQAGTEYAYANLCLIARVSPHGD